MDAHDLRTPPEGWKWCEISEVAAQTKYPIGDGDHGQIKPSMYTNSGIPYIRVADISKGEIKKEKLVYISKETHENNLKSELHPDDIIISKTGATIGKVAIIPDEIPLANTTASVGKITLDKNKMIPKFLFHFMNTSFFQNQMWSVSFKSAQPGFNIINLKKFKILIPPLPTQRRIVTILEKAEETKKFRAQADELTNRLLQSVFLDMFGDPEKNEKNFESSKLGDLSLRITKGESPKWQGFDYIEKGVTFITSENVLWGTLSINNLKYIPIKFHEKLRRSSLEPNNILVNLVGASIGRVCIVNKEILPANINQAVAVISLDKEKLNPYFALYYFLSPTCQRVLRSNIVDAARANISLTNLNELDVIVPPLPLQQKFARLVEKVESMRQSQNQSKQQIGDLFSTLMQKAFRGEI